MFLFSLLVGLASSCPFEHSVLVGPSKKEVFDLFVLTQNNKGGGVVHCSSIWPNQEPHAAVFPVPPGCLYINVDQTIAPAGAVPMQLPGGQKIYWIPETEYPNGFQIAAFPVKCDRVISRTNWKSKTAIIGQNCHYSGTSTGCGKPTRVERDSVCLAETEGVEFTGFGKDGVQGGLHPVLKGETKGNGYLWLPRQMFADPDEMLRNNENGSISLNINIENPTVVSPPQIVQIHSFPLEVHARVNEPKSGVTHAKVQIPKPVWITECTSEKGKDLASLMGIPQEHRLGFMDGKVVMKLLPKGNNYATTYIPSGNPDDLFLAVVTTATSAIVGALAIIVTSLRKLHTR